MSVTFGVPFVTPIYIGVYYPTREQYRLPVMVMEKMQHSLRGLVENYINIPLNVKLSILDEVCLGLRYLHSRNPPIVHRDLTPNNILLGSRLEAKITDLGVAKVMQTDSNMTMTKIPGTPDFMPPESITQKPVYGPALDVFSFGGVALNVITQQWPTPTDREQFNSVTDRWEVVSEVTRRQGYLNMFAGGATDLVPLVTSCLSDNSQRRPSVMQVSMEINRVKDVCSHQTGHDGMSPIVWWAEVSSQSSSQHQQQQVTSLITQLEEMTMRCGELRREVDVVKAENDGLQIVNNSLSVENNGLKVENNGLKVENNGLMVEVNGLKVENNDLMVEVDGLKVENNRLKVENNRLMVEVDGLKVENNGLKVVNNGLKVEDNGLKVEINGLRVENNSLKEENARLQAENQQTTLIADQRSSLPPPVHRQSKQRVISDKSREQLIQSLTPDLFSGAVKITWQEGDPAPVCHANHTAVFCDGKVYIGGGYEGSKKAVFGTGFYRIDVYNLGNNSWSPSPISTPFCDFAMTTLNNQLITAGGKDSSGKVTNKTLLMDDSQLKQYTRMITPRYYGTAAGHQGTLIVAGGKDDKYRTLATTELFDSITGQCYTTSNLPLPHYLLHSVIADNILYLVGGHDQDGSSSPTVFTAPLDTLPSHQLRWVSQHNTPCSSSAPVSIQGRHVLTIGGMRTNNVYRFNKVSRSWGVIEHMPSPRSRPAAASVTDNKIVVVGGYSIGQKQYTNTVWIGLCEPQ
ncbi:serine/threonine-protein kinase WNK-like isoform X2 [Dysidea avara]|uniref:serine/threonine-protein kinase WNK-like isoform X2 n=1 Tax=Dysidea avara TaxID=196820 RepID=UPI0033263BBC